MATTITANGINFPDGSAGSPSIGGTDTNTGLFTGSDIVGFATGGSERLRIDASGNINIANDSGKLQLGTSADLKIFHNGTRSKIENLTGDLRICGNDIKLKNYDDDETYITCVDDGSVNLYHNNDLRLQTWSDGVNIYGDEGEAAILHLYADDGDDSADKWRLQSGTSGDFYIQNYASGSWETSIDATANGNVRLMYDNSPKLATTSTGTTTTGDGYLTGRLLVGTTTAGESNGDEATFANTGGNAGITIRSAVDAEAKIYFSEGTSGGSQYRGSITYSQNTNYMSFGTNENERVRITSSGGIRIGDTYDPHNTVDDVLIATSGDTGVTIRSGTSSGGHIVFADGSSGSDRFRGFVDYKHSDDSMRLGTNDAERLRIDSSGNVGIGTSSPSTGGKGISFQPFVANDTSRMLFNRNSSGYMQTVLEFLNDGSTVGSIKHSNSSTQYNTSSDYRLKENVVAISDGITRLKTLSPYRFNFKNNKDITVDGFLAHEVTAVPEAVSGTKDGMKSIYYKNGDTIPENKKIGDFKEYSTTEPEYQQIDQSKLVPLLTAALQEAVGKIETLETKVAALEAE